MKKILIITHASEKAEQALQPFMPGLNVGEDVFAYAMIQDLVFRIENGAFGIRLNGKELREQADALHLRNLDIYPDYANAVRVYAEANNIQMVNQADARLPYYGKLSQGALLAVNGVPTPDLLTAFDNRVLIGELTKADWQYPFVVKHNTGGRGVDNFLIRDTAQLQKVLSEARPGFIAQPFIENTGELRVLTFGETVDPLVFRKFAAEGEYLNNTSQGGGSELLAAEAIPRQMLQDARTAARLMGRDIGGVDVLLARDGGHYILEVNTTPAIASGVYLAQKQDLYRQYFSDGRGV